MALPKGVTVIQQYADGTARGSDGRLYKMENVTSNVLMPGVTSRWDDDYQGYIYFRNDDGMGEGSGGRISPYNDEGSSETWIGSPGGSAYRQDTTRDWVDIGEDPVAAIERQTREAQQQQQTLLTQMREQFAAEEAKQREAFAAEQKAIADSIAKQKADFEAARVKRTEDRKQSQLTTAKTQLSDIQRMSGFREQLSTPEDVKAQQTGLTEEEEKKVFGKAKTFLQKLLES